MFWKSSMSRRWKYTGGRPNPKDAGDSYVVPGTGCKLEFLAVKYPFSILVKMEHIHLNLGSNKKPNRYPEFFMRFSVLERIALLFEYFYTKYPFMPYSNSFLSDQYSK